MGGGEGPDHIVQLFVLWIQYCPLQYGFLVCYGPYEDMVWGALCGYTGTDYTLRCPTYYVHTLSQTCNFIPTFKPVFKFCGL